MSIGDRLRAERETRGLTQSAVADQAGASKRTVQNWESGASAPTAADLEALAKLGFDVRFVVTGERDYSPPPPLAAEEIELLDDWRRASREAKNAARGALLGAEVGAVRTQQIFKGAVGQVVKGDYRGSTQKFTFAAAPKRGPKKP